MVAVTHVDGDELAVRALDRQAGDNKTRRHRLAPPTELPSCPHRCLAQGQRSLGAVRASVNYVRWRQT